MVGQEIDNVRLSTVLKVLSIVCGLGLIGIGLVKLTSFSFDRFLDIMLSLYFVIFGVLLILMELPFPKLLTCFSFLGYYIGKAMFLLFCGTLMFGWQWYEIALSICLFIASILYFMLTCMCKDKLFQRDSEGRKVDENGNPIDENARAPAVNQQNEQPPAAVPVPQNEYEGAFAPANDDSAPE